MNKYDLFLQFKNWYSNGENEKIIAAIIALPESAIDDDILNWLTEAYIDVGEYKKAIAVLESQRSRMDGDYRWHFRMGLALFHASEDEECEDDDELRINILERASAALARGMNMNPPADALSTADMYMERIEDALDELNEDEDEDDEPENFDELELYDGDELDVIEEHIKEYYGDFPTVFHEISSPDIHCDVYIIPPNDEKNYYTLITVGMGAHLMNIPDDLDASEYGRAELLICLPPDWKVGENKEEWFWPISLLKSLSRLPINSNTWLGWGHSVDNQQTYAENTELCGALLIYPENVEDGAESCNLPSGDRVNFFEVIPIYREEMNFKIENGTTALLEKMQQVSPIVDISRPNCCGDYHGHTPFATDSVSDHIKKITEKNLPLDPINGANHIAIFMRWCIEHKLIAPEFYENCPDIVDGVLSGKKTDLREFIRDFFDGDLAAYQMNCLGANFLRNYYDWENEDSKFFYPSDVDAYAEEYFGTERYNSEEFQDEAYLFVPFDEDYYKGMCKYIDRAFFDFYPSFAEWYYNTGCGLLETANRMFGLKGSAVRHYEYVKDEYEKAQKAITGNDNIPIVAVLSENVPDSLEQFEEILRNSLDPFSENIAVMEIPKRGFTEYCEARGLTLYDVLVKSDTLSELREKTLESFGCVPLVVTCYDGEDKERMLFLPHKDGFLRYTDSE